MFAMSRANTGTTANIFFINGAMPSEIPWALQARRISSKCEYSRFVWLTLIECLFFMPAGLCKLRFHSLLWCAHKFLNSRIQLKLVMSEL